MAKAKVIHSDDACLIQFNGDKCYPEPATGVIQFPGGHVEVSRCTDGTYWAHIAVVSPANIIGSRLDFTYGAPVSVTDIPNGDKIDHIAIRIANAVPRP